MFRRRRKYAPAARLMNQRVMVCLRIEAQEGKAKATATLKRAMARPRVATELRQDWNHVPCKDRRIGLSGRLPMRGGEVESNGHGCEDRDCRRDVQV